MFNNLIKSAYLTFNKVKIVHSIPGRLRLLIPGLSDVPEDFKKYEHYITDFILSKKGIKSVEYCFKTSKALIYYSPEILSAEQITDWLNMIWKTVMNHSELYEGKSLEEIEENIDVIYDILKKGKNNVK